jgi:HK97 family phage prohead protease
MPYFITDDAEGCPNWAMVKENGEVQGCHDTKEDAIAHMVAASLTEGIRPGGEIGNDDDNDDDNERQQHMNVEFRTFDAGIIEVRAADTGDGMTFGGYAARYNSPSLPLPFTEVIAPGAFDRTLKSKNDIRAYINHDERLILGSTRAKTLRLESRDDGLYSEIDLPDTSYARDLSVSIQRGDVRTMSFGFSTVKDSWSDANNRTLVEVRLHEVSAVSGVAAYASTTASVRNLQLIAKRTATDIEALSDAIAALEAGEMSNDQADVLLSVVDRSRPHVDIVEPELVAAVTPLTVLMKQLDLIAKTF